MLSLECGSNSVITRQCAYVITREKLSLESEANDRSYARSEADYRSYHSGVNLMTRVSQKCVVDGRSHQLAMGGVVLVSASVIGKAAVAAELVC